MTLDTVELAMGGKVEYLVWQYSAKELAAIYEKIYSW